ncbi:MAG: hypothetical protein N3B10_10100 [Armatimonadetes bacterium]|nr:hypothetical protein [Armatimonadota bacterium]
MTNLTSADFSRRDVGTGEIRLQIFRAGLTCPYDEKFSPNEFGAQKTRHQPLAKASGMSDLKDQPCLHANAF